MGGRDLDIAVAKHLAEDFKIKHYAKIDVTNEPKSWLNLID